MQSVSFTLLNRTGLDRRYRYLLPVNEYNTQRVPLKISARPASYVLLHATYALRKRVPNGYRSVRFRLVDSVSKSMHKGSRGEKKPANHQSCVPRVVKRYRSVLSIYVNMCPSHVQWDFFPSVLRSLSSTRVPRTFLRYRVYRSRTWTIFTIFARSHSLISFYQKVRRMFFYATFSSVITRTRV